MRVGPPPSIAIHSTPPGRQVWQGFRLGMLLQLAVGPVCLFVFQAASAGGVLPALGGVAGVALVDAAYIALANLGVAAFVGRKRVRAVMKIFGAVVLCLFGASTVLAQFGLNPLPGLSLGDAGASGAFPRALILTASNPLTILFWAGVFAGKVAELNGTKKETWLFGLGAVLSTLAFLAAVAAAGSLLKSFLPAVAITILNVAVGAALVFFGVRMAVSKH